MEQQLVALPTPATVAYLRTVFDGCPIEIDWEGLYVELPDSAASGENREYVAFAYSLSDVYDGVSTNWVIRLISEEPELHGASFVIRWNKPVLKRHRRGLLKSYSDIIYASQHPLVFSNVQYVEV